MFSGCKSLTSLDLNNFNTQNLTNMAFMFEGCTSLTSLDISNFKSNYLVDMEYMFSGCFSLKYIDMSGFVQELNAFETSSLPDNCTIKINDKSNIALKLKNKIPTSCEIIKIE